MRLSVLGSGSAGNSILFGSEELGYWLVDAGLSTKQITLRLNVLGVELTEVKGVFITHEHKDHIGGLPVLLRKHSELQVFASILTQEYLKSQLGMEANWFVFEPGQRFEVGAFLVEAISIPHDATDPVGFLFEAPYVKVAILTDLGYVAESLTRQLMGVEILYLESNYDVKLLELDTKRPWSIKQRISSRHGHLSNEQAKDLVTALRKEGLKKVVLGHLSQDCNHPECIMDIMKGLPAGLEYEISSQKVPTPWLEVRPSDPTPVDASQWTQLTLF